MLPDLRASERFFQGVAEVCPVPSLSHLHLVHWPEGFPTPLPPLLEAGFQGALVAARVSIAQAARILHPQLSVLVDDHPTAGEPADHILMELPQGREAARRAVQAALEALSAQGRLWLFGIKETGILSLPNHFSGAESILYKGHMRLIALPKTSQLLTERASPAPVALATDGFHHLHAAGLEFATLPGIFSWTELDPASTMLLDSITEDPGAELLDWGCGSGLLGISLAQRWPKLRVVMSDDQWAAVRCARRSCELNGVTDRCTVLAEDGIGAQLANRRFDAIISNPPLHRGIRNDTGPLRTFLPEAVKRLKTNGSLWLVGNRTVNFEKILQGHFQQITRVNSNNRFAVWRGIK